ncbi:CPCC family cysteine-rich protein [Streptomyces sp. CB03911]|uniref:CPCC family cysteine-rich protein n=1 Tax=Streptomyces sp. CB03911 TaxID=1804758 RepID=UPI000938C4B2|nr:CPCC family cysteine-rich protein [Streptomyces sp. CB03911]
MDTRRPCPCCGRLVFDLGEGWPGSGIKCPVCFWEDDAAQFRWPLMPGGANQVRLVQAQRNVREIGAFDHPGLRFVRPPAADEPTAPGWRPIDPATDVFADWRGEDHRPSPEDPSVLCWWLPSFRGLPEDPDPEPDRHVVIDVGQVRGERDLHAVLKRELGFPGCYGMNWAAFRDAVSGLVAMPDNLSFVHWAELELREPSAAALLRQQLTRYHAFALTHGFPFNVTYDQDDPQR